MTGLQKVLKIHGAMTIQGVRWLWDYAADEPVRKSEMPVGSERWKESERVRVGALTEHAKAFASNLKRIEGKD